MEKFTLDLNIVDRTILEDIAKEKGYASAREFINDQVKNFPADLDQDKLLCDGKPRKCKNIYDIPKENERFYSKLACVHSTTVSAIIFRYVILPHLANRRIVRLLCSAKAVNPDCRENF